MNATQWILLSLLLAGLAWIGLRSWITWLGEDTERAKYLCENLGDESWNARCTVCGQLEQYGNCPNDGQQWHRTYRRAA